MTHLWVKAEQRPNEEPVGLTATGAAVPARAGSRVTVEKSSVGVIPVNGYATAGCEFADQTLYPSAPLEAIVFGLKDLPEEGTPLPCSAMPSTASLPDRCCCSGREPGAADLMIWRICSMQPGVGSRPMASGPADLPSMRPIESSEGFAARPLPRLLTLGDLTSGVWGRARPEFDRHSAAL